MKAKKSIKILDNDVLYEQIRHLYTREYLVNILKFKKRLLKKILVKYKKENHIQAIFYLGEIMGKFGNIEEASEIKKRFINKN